MTNPKTGAERIKANRDARRAAGLVEFRCWCTPKQREVMQAYMNTAQLDAAHRANAKASAEDV